MKSILSILLCLAMQYPANAQETDDDAGLANKVQKAIREFNSKRNSGKEPEKEIVVVLPPPDPQSETKSEPQEEEPAVVPPPSKEEPKLVTGKPPLEEPAETTGDAAAETPAPQAEEPLETITEEKQGLEIRIESIRGGSGKIDPGQIKLKASFPAKSLSATPVGWILEKSEQAPAFRKEVTLRPGKTIFLSITPHVLEPASDGANTFAVVEPGFDVSAGYRQSNTVSAILGNSVAQLDRDALLLGNAISDLHQLLASLPKPDPQPEDIAKP